MGCFALLVLPTTNYE
jgi:hypothetical protein